MSLMARIVNGRPAWGVEMAAGREIDACDDGGARSGHAGTVGMAYSTSTF